MERSLLEQYRIADFLAWHGDGLLILNPSFQRGPVWRASARIFLIDTILRGFPIPKIFIRTHIDAVTKKTRREVVDGQQRLRAIIDFANDKLRLSAKAQEFKGKTYSSLDPEDQEKFLSYAIAADQLVNAADRDVLEAFSRLNSYTVVLNAAERRHAMFQGEFKIEVRAAAQKWSVLWDEYKVLSVRDCVRMQNDELFAQMYDIVMHGIRDFSQEKLNKLYRDYDKEFEQKDELAKKIDTVLETVVTLLPRVIEAEKPMSRSPQFLILFAAVAHALFGIPNGDLEQLPAREGLLSDPEMAVSNLDFLNELLMDSIPAPQLGPPFSEFYDESRSTTQRIRSRGVRFRMLINALKPEPIF